MYGDDGSILAHGGKRRVTFPKASETAGMKPIEVLNWHQLLVAVGPPLLCGTLTSGLQNWIQRDDIRRSVLGGLVAAIVTLLFSYLAVAFGGK